MELEKAKQIGKDVLKEISRFVDRSELAGSIRRNKPVVNDIDIVMQPKNEFMALENIKNILKSYGKIELEGSKVLRIKSIYNLKIDCYIANNKNYEVLLFIRTGSKEHNRMLATEALKQGKKLSYSDGIIDLKTKKIIANTEIGIFKTLNVDYVEPEKREVN